MPLQFSRTRNGRYNAPVSAESHIESPVSDPKLTQTLEVAPEMDVESWRLAVPARGACYTLEDSCGDVVLAATCADLRKALLARLGPAPEGQPPSRKIDYRAVVRRVRWREAFSRFEADWTYMETVRSALPRSFKRLIRHLRAHWVHVNPADAHPRFIATDEPSRPLETCFGPLPDARAAAAVVALLEDLFDLCRYHHILIQAPHGQACSYKQMGRCPAPCDGSISLDAYREQIEQAVQFLQGPREPWIRQLEHRMRAAAQQQAFELAARYKQSLDRTRPLDSPRLRWLRPLTHMRYVGLFQGRGRGSVRAFRIDVGCIEYLGQIDRRKRDAAVAELAERVATWTPRSIESLDHEEFERLGLIGWHLLDDRQRGAFVEWTEARDPHSLGAAIEQLDNAKATENHAPTEMQ